MLVLSRRQSEKIVIADVITVEVLQIRGKTARIRICAPPEYDILRGELVGSPVTGSSEPRLGGTGGLVLSRKKGETILIAGRIVITVVDIRGKNVRLGTDAPREYAIVRTSVAA